VVVKRWEEWLRFNDESGFFLCHVICVWILKGQNRVVWEELHMLDHEY